MALVALLGRRYVVWPLGLSVRRNKASVVTGITLPGRSRMAHRRRRERRGCFVAGVTYGAGRNMGHRLAETVRIDKGAIVAGRAGDRTDRIVVHAGGLPGHGGMTVLASS